MCWGHRLYIWKIVGIKSQTYFSYQVSLRGSGRVLQPLPRRVSGSSKVWALVIGDEQQPVGICLCFLNTSMNIYRRKFEMFMCKNLDLFRFARTCHLNTDGNVVCDCQPGYVGLRCEHCAPGFTGNPLQPGDTCRPASQCDPQGTLGQDAEGRCLCKVGIATSLATIGSRKRIWKFP